MHIPLDETHSSTFTCGTLAVTFTLLLSVVTGKSFPEETTFTPQFSDSRGFCSRLISTEIWPVRLSAILTAKKTIKKGQAVPSFEHLPQIHGVILTDTRSSQRLALKLEFSKCPGPRPFDRRLRSAQPFQRAVRWGGGSRRCRQQLRMGKSPCPSRCCVK